MAHIANGNHPGSKNKENKKYNKTNIEKIDEKNDEIYDILIDKNV